MRASDRAAAVLVLLLACAAALLCGPALDARLLDAQYAVNRAWFPQALGTDVVVVGIDDAFVDSIEEPLALSHRHLAQFLHGAVQGGAAVIALDVVLPEKRYDQLFSASHPDLDFHRLLLAGLIDARQHSQLVVAKAWDYQRQRYLTAHIDIDAVLGGQALASALVCRDPDGRVRAYPGAACQPDASDLTLASEVAAAMGRRQAWSGLIDYQAGPLFRYVPLQQVLTLARSGDNAALQRLFKGRAVMLGSVQADVDLIDVPVALAAWLPQSRRVPGVLVHAQIVRGMLNDGMVIMLPAPLVMAAALLCCLFWLHPSIAAKLALLLGASLILLGASNLLLRHGVWMAPGSMLLAAWISALGRSGWQAWQHFRDKQRLGRTFSGYVSPQVLRQILSGAIDARDSGRKLQVCVMFTDIRGFTAMSEQLPAEQIVALLNRYFTRMTMAVHRHGGTVDKFIGDGMMVFFGAPNQLDDPTQAAFDAGRAMLAELAVLNGELRAEGKAELAIGIGIHVGMAVIGHIGSVERHEYTAIGDAVNIAARLEGLCAPLDCRIVCSGAAACSLGYPPALLALGEHPLKGHTPLQVFGYRGDC